MRIVEINLMLKGSTGRIMTNIAKKAREPGHEVRTYSTHCFNRKYTRLEAAPEGHTYFGTFLENTFHYAMAQFTGRNGCHSRLGTGQMLRGIKRFKPDVIHLHNLHNFCVYVPGLFRFLKKQNTPVIWTLHDCWAFTGHCCYFTLAKCDKWKTGCHDCGEIGVYPAVKVDRSREMYEKKKAWFTGVPNMTIVTPSQWLADLVKESYLKDYPVKVIRNGIDLNLFKPTESDFRERYGLEGKIVLLGVAYGWGRRKGLDVFLELAKRLDDRYRIVLVGTDDKVDKELPENIISIHRTHNQAELAEIYTAADLFVNPTREDNYPTTNMEALACGTPVLTFRTGGSPEIPDETCGAVVGCDDADALISEVIRITETHPYTTEACLNRAKAFDMNHRFEEYVKLYEEITG